MTHRMYWRQSCATSVLEPQLIPVARQSAHKSGDKPPLFSARPRHRASCCHLRSPAHLLSSCRKLASPHLATGHFQWLLLVLGTACHLVSDPHLCFASKWRQCCSRCHMDNQTTITVQGSETWVDTQKKPGGFYSGKPTLKTIKKTPPQI